MKSDSMYSRYPLMSNFADEISYVPIGLNYGQFQIVWVMVIFLIQNFP